MRIALIAGLVALAIAGCSGHKQTYASKEGTTTVESGNNGKTVTVTTKEGTATYGRGAVDTAKLGLPIYPGATANEGSLSGKSAQGTGEIVVLSSTDSFDKVYTWYKAHMPAGSEAMHMTTPAGAMAAFKLGKDTDKDQKNVTLTADKNKTSIMLSHTVKP